ncbi:hypothetical protein DAA51_06085 [Bradyrhizobium sp. WBAH10]|nr:hypothetical protein [Bradyrhizobium sp. WBAH30]MDD1543704.1 hypothetical protein [Bradyrhizobium sp. WBAH41]MDD1558011.1 hypothetical protein [Bradyrhizobium sp. WBAH23]MDD1565423.1 hypothetical protein [Bradyrhizobium sp. WBAH33]MDD1592755.1 hypothetical protein [Bradyrhizobium sp. WBAH42]NRB88536.1 hypothetical protein [Bradyrhizobium sp. WBAH10]QCJ88320.1 hypothetical protein DAA57_07205 [Bradyrhizobium yuanmingense]
MRAQRSNPEFFRGEILDCFVARAPRNDGVERVSYTLGMLAGRTSRACAASLMPALAAPKP